MVSVLFGAGAEANLGVGFGPYFALAVLGIEPKQLKDAVDLYLRGKTKAINDEWYPSYKSGSFGYKDLYEASFRAEGLYKSDSSTKKGFEKKIKEECSKFILCSKKKQKKEICKMDSFSYMGIIDGAFHTIINPKILGSDRFWRVVQSYTAAYAFIVGGMIGKKNIKAEDYLKILNDPVFANKVIDEFVEKKKDIDSYYSILKDYPNVRLITTNYTPLCKELSGRDNDSVAHPHGRLNLFESPKTLTVYDSRSANGLPSTELLFPYISIQSGVKPVIDPIQIEEYWKMISFLKESRLLFVVGYNLNPDDNHLIAIIRRWLKEREDRKLVYFNYGNSSISGELIRKRLRLDLADSQVEVVHISDTDAYAVFRDYLDKYEA